MTKERRLVWDPRTRLFRYDPEYGRHDLDPMARTARMGLLTPGWSVGPDQPYRDRFKAKAYDAWYLKRARALSMVFGYATLHGFAKAMGMCWKTLDIQPSEYPGLKDDIPWIRLDPRGWRYMDLEVMPRILLMAVKWTRFYGRTLRNPKDRWAAEKCRAIHREMLYLKERYDVEKHRDRLRLYLSRRRLPVVLRQVELERVAEARIHSCGIEADIQRIGCIRLISTAIARKIRGDAPEILPGSVGLADLAVDLPKSVYSSLVAPLSVVTPVYPRREELYRAAGEVWK